MKHKNDIQHLIMMLFLLCFGLNSLAQGFVVEKTNGKTERFFAIEVKSITPFGYDYMPAPVRDTVVTFGGKDYTFCYVEGGTFMYGADENNVGTLETVPSFWITQKEIVLKFPRVHPDTNGNGIIDSSEFISWLNDMCRWYRNASDEIGVTIQLATRILWEYAARGGVYSHGYTYSGSNDINEVAWYKGNSGGEEHDLATKKPNELGIYDMCGNYPELVFTGRNGGYFGVDIGASFKSPLIVGGGFKDEASDCRITSKALYPDEKNGYISTEGFEYEYVAYRLIMLAE